jgi:retron-type reverse transcriptase
MKEPVNQKGMFELADGQYRPDTDREGQQRSGSQRTNQLPAARQSLAQEPSQVSKVREYEVIERVYEPGRLHEAWQQVRRNAGAAGIDQMTVEMFERREDELLALIHEKLKAGTYRFKPARRVLIPKEGSSKMRPLGIPVVMDRIVSQSINLVLFEIFDPMFTEANFGFAEEATANTRPLNMFKAS